MKLRPFTLDDADQLDQLALKAFAQYSEQYHPWEEFRSKIAAMSKMQFQIILAELDGVICGAIGYVAPTGLNSAYFKGDWAAIRMLVVDPDCRGNGLGRSLTEECIKTAKADKCKAIALHTSPIMEVALALYVRMGFQKVRDIDPIYTVPYAIYKLDLA